MSRHLATSVLRGALPGTVLVAGTHALLGVARSDAAEDGRPEETGVLSSFLVAPPFRADGDRYDQSSFVGRAAHFLDVLGDVSTLITSEAECEAKVALLRDHAAGCSTATDAELWRAKKVKDAMVHPATGEIIPAPLRFTAFAPVNLVLCAGLLQASTAPTLAASAFWQWSNQTYNMAVNHANRAGGAVSQEKLALAYVSATSAALAVALGLQRASRSLGGSALVRLTVPMLGVCTGGVVNLLATRSDELSNGIPVYTADGEHLLGRSHAAAQTALAKCSASRVAWSVALLTIAPIVAGAACRALPARLAARRAATVFVELGATFGVIWLSVPVCLAIWPQQARAAAADLEPEFAAARHPATGDLVSEVVYNKGL